MRKIKSVFVLLLVAVAVMSMAVPAYAATKDAKKETCAMDIQLTDNIGFKMYENQTNKESVANPEKGKSYTSDSYSGYFYLISTGQIISTHRFTASFSYDGTLASCYSTASRVLMDDNYSGNLRPKAEGEGRNNLTPTLVYGYVTFVLYNQNGSVNTEVTVNIYCNQRGTTWIERQG